jgi:hypothetical protein
VASRDDPRPALYAFHIGKTGGTALNETLLEHADACSYRLIFGGHTLTLRDVPPGERFMFVIRDPLKRFVSAFNGRLREDRPRYHYPWRDEEKAAFEMFTTPDQLATALSSDDPEERRRAEDGMKGIGHVNTSYSYWFDDEQTFRSRLSDLFFIGFTERLNDDFELLKARLGMPIDLQLPQDETAAHRTPAGFSSQLSEAGRANLERWYARDIAFVRLCRELAPRVNSPG